MDKSWRVVARVRDLRARLAQQEVLQRRQIQARAQAALREARRVQEYHERQSGQTSALLAARADPLRGAVVSAGEAQDLLRHALAARLRAQEAQTPIRRAQLHCQRVGEEVDAASMQHRRELQRREAIFSQWSSRLRTARWRALEREDERLRDEWSASKLAQRLADGND